MCISRARLLCGHTIVLLRDSGNYIVDAVSAAVNVALMLVEAALIDEKVFQSQFLPSR
jgi:hypothetical protein